MILWLFEYTQCVDDYFNEISIASMLCNQQLPKSAEMGWSTPVNMMHDICLNGHIDVPAPYPYLSQVQNYYQI